MGDQGSTIAVGVASKKCKKPREISAFYAVTHILIPTILSVCEASDRDR